MREHQVVDHLLLAIDGDGSPDQLGEVDVMAGALALQVDTVVHEAVLLQSPIEAEVREHLDG